MTDLEISKALALAIGWKKDDIAMFSNEMEVWSGGWRTFDYRDWNVIGPIAERYNFFPQRAFYQWQVRGWTDTLADTTQKAIALAVIKGTVK